MSINKFLGMIAATVLQMVWPVIFIGEVNVAYRTSVS